MSYPYYKKSRQFATAARRSGDLNSQTATYVWKDLDNGLDLVLDADENEFIEVGASGLWGNESTVGALDVVSVISGSPVNSWGKDAAVDNTHSGISAWRGSEAGVYTHICGGIRRMVVAGDIDANGRVTLRLRTKTSTNVAKTFFGGGSGYDFVWWAENVGPKRS